MQQVRQLLQERATGDFLTWEAQVAIAEECGLTRAQVEEVALALGILPFRYQRNLQTISVENQLRLFRSRVAVLGLGGLGGNILEGLARLGVGTIVAVDPDVFQEHNLNRQVLSSVATLEQPKVDSAVARIREINPAVTVIPVQDAYRPETGKDLLQGVNVVVDGLDSIPTRLALASTCAEMQIPLVHGAIAGWYGQVTTQFPGDRSIEALYSRWVQGKGAEERLGNPSFTPALVASIETAEVCKILLGIGQPLRGRKLVINLLEMSFEEILFEPPAEQESRTVEAENRLPLKLKKVRYIDDGELSVSI
jgi:molybdopterin/thiamine biosynthesis adenylyltransferase